MTKIAEIHQIYPEILENRDKFSDIDIFTFDDGLYSQFKYREFFLSFNKPLYFFISPFYVREDEPSKDFIYSDEAQKLTLEKNDRSYFMSLPEIRYLSKLKNVHIGGHSYAHKFFGSKVKDMKDALDDFNKMMMYFNEKNIKIDSFCYPYEHYVSVFHQMCLKNNLKIFGEEKSRILVENILGLKINRKVFINR